jgi:hypothetical protein
MTPEPLAAVVLVDAVVLRVAVVAGVEAAVELLLELLPHPASSARAAAAAAPTARGRVTMWPPVAGMDGSCFRRSDPGPRRNFPAFAVYR